jgi:STE24 endopeptidase
MLGGWLILASPLRAAPAPAPAEEVPVTVPAPSALALRYYQSGHGLWALRAVWALAVPTALLFTGASARLRDVARAVGRSRFFTAGGYAVLFLGLTFLIDLPFEYYRGFVRPHAYGLANQTFARWFRGVLKERAVLMLLGFLLLGIPYELLRRHPRRWWLVCGLLAIPLLFGLMFLKPIGFDPLFNHFRPLHDKALEQKIQALAHRAGIAGGRIFEVDKSHDTKTVNAYVTGVLGSKRIVLWDTLLARLNEKEVLFVLGHEMGHYVLGHVARSLLLLSLLVLLGLWLVHRVSGPLIARFGTRFGFDTLADVASLPLFLVVFELFGLVALPVAMAYSRAQEHEADRFALEITRTNHSAGTAFVKLQEENLSHPRPGWFYKLWRASHPSLGERIDFCNTYHPWRTGRPLRYGHLFRAAAAVPAGSTEGIRGRRSGSGWPGGGEFGQWE